MFNQNNMVNVQCYVVLNEAGNILIKTNQAPSKQLPEHLQKLFLEAVSCLCMMTKAISTTINPNTGKAFSIYDHSALEQVLEKHPLFLPLAQESSQYKVKHDQDFVHQSSNNFLGAENNASVKRKMSSIYSSMYMTANTLKNEKNADEVSRLGRLILCCESLLGVPFVTMQLIHINREECSKIPQKHHKSWWDFSTKIVELRKDTYLFNSPSLLLEYDTPISTD